MNPPATILDRLAGQFPAAKRGTLRRMIADGRVRVKGTVVRRANQPVGEGDEVIVSDRPAGRERVVEEPAPASPQYSALASRIVFEDDDLLVIDKPAGLLTSTVPREPRPTLWAWVRAYVADQGERHRAGLIHRLDQGASGLLVFSKNNEAYESLKSQFFHHTVRREYRAVVHGIPTPPAGVIDTYLVERADGSVHSTRQHGKGQRAVTEYQTLRTERKLSLMAVTLQTGRKHQIRVHLCERGSPVVGDALYGPPDSAPRLMLAAVRLSLRHPRNGNDVTFAIPTPPDFPLRDSDEPPISGDEHR